MKIQCITLTNGDAALFINGQTVYTLEATDSGTNPATLGENIALASGIKFGLNGLA